MSSISILFESYLFKQCAPAKQRKEDEEAEKKMDRFTRSKKKIAAEIRETKRVCTISS